MNHYLLVGGSQKTVFGKSNREKYLLKALTMVIGSIKITLLTMRLLVIQ